MRDERDDSRSRHFLASLRRCPFLRRVNHGRVATCRLMGRKIAPLRPHDEHHVYLYV